MAYQKTKTAQVAGSELSLIEHDGWDFSSVKWEQQYLCTAYKRESDYELKPEYTIVKDYPDLSGVFPSLEEVFIFVSNYLSEHPDLQDKLRTAHQAAKDWNKKRIEEGRAEETLNKLQIVAHLGAYNNINMEDLLSKLTDYVKDKEVVYQSFGGLVEVSNDKEAKNKAFLLKALDTEPCVETYKKDDFFIAEDFKDINDWSKEDDILLLLSPTGILICISKKEAAAHGLLTK